MIEEENTKQIKNSMNNPLISIITVSFNRKNTIEKTILSVLNQDYRNIEYIIIDGGSIDGTLDIINKYKDSISVVISEKDNGMYDALNKGINLANGEYIGICHSDDYYYSNNIISALVSNIMLSNADIYHGDLLSKNTNTGKEQIIKSNDSVICQTHNSILHPSTFIKKKVFKLIGLYNTNYKSAADYELMIRIKQNNFKFNHLGIIVSIISIGDRDRVSNNCFSNLEAYQFHKKLKTGNHRQYIYRFINCMIRKMVKKIIIRK